MHVAELWRYPVKSMGGERLQDAVIDRRGIPGDRGLYVVDARGTILSARNRPRLLGHRATIDEHGEVLVDGRPWTDQAVARDVGAAAGAGARIVRASGPERFDILPLLVATDGAIAAFGHDRRRLRPNLVVGGVPGLAERSWEWRQLAVGEAVVALADLRGRCIITTWDPDAPVQDVDVLRHIRSELDGSLALNAWIGREGRVAVGDAVRLLAEEVDVADPEPGRFVVPPVPLGPG
jgi:uncharacterized protein YcbX